MIRKHVSVDTFIFTKSDIETYVRSEVERRLGPDHQREKRQITVEWGKIPAHHQLELPVEIVTVTAELKSQANPGDTNGTHQQK
jgi:hypothetical protein